MAKTVIDTRSAAKKAKDARFRKEPVARVQSPLQFIRIKTGSEMVTPEGGKVWVDSQPYLDCLALAQAGRGRHIQGFARFIA